MKKSLNHIADVLTGVTLREKPVPTKQARGNVFLMQLGDLNTDGTVQTHSMIPTQDQSLFEKFTVKSGDIVFRGRGAGIVAAVVPETEWPVVAASPLIIIRPNTQKVDPHYLVWALTNDQARRYYAEHARGSNIVGIGKRDLDLLEINLPPMAIQKKIGQLKNLETEEQHLLTRYQKAKARLVEALIVDAIYKEKAA
jgi:restriction endonuclease S subunit